ncbi:MAG: bifunctional phosphoribosyl-AMP cyclohydrolase/phosphoribosyl-ATP diphosphatase HisIE [Nitrospira sp.]|nr:bifunctional phosphoribosyl-AMP cyclohydrolase/phosphoribosyl-ATP diphosphatase HisIE [Nitrospira sp.]
MDLNHLKWDKQGLIPAVIQDWRSGTILMLGYMNPESLQLSLEKKTIHFWSRERKRIWEKGETSGNRLLLKDIFVDCDGDTLLVKAEPMGPTCHTNAWTCFFLRMRGDGSGQLEKTTDGFGAGILDTLYRTIQDRKAHPSAESYTSTLLTGGVDKVLKKVVEEAGEVALAAKGGKKNEIVYEVADLLFHTLVALGYHDVNPDEIYRELANRYGVSGLKAKVNSALEKGATK